MSIKGLYMLNTPGHTEEKIHVLKILYMDKKNEFSELSKAFLGKKKLNEMENSKEFVLNYCLDKGILLRHGQVKSPHL